MNKKALGLIGLGAVAAVGGSLAYYNHTATLDNPLTTTHFGDELVEEFTPPPTDLYPGAEWDKNVGASNTGDYPVLVRIRMDETWNYKGESDNYIEFGSEDTQFAKIIEDTDGAYLADQKDHDVIGDDGQPEMGEDGQPLKTDGDSDGDTEDDNTTVFKNIVNVSSTEKPVGWHFNQSDGYWYWNAVLEPATDAGPTRTADLLDGLVLAKNIDMGLYNKQEWYQFADKNTSKENLDNNAWQEVNLEGVADANGDGKFDIYDFVEHLGGVPEGKKLFRKSDSTLDPNKKGYADSSYNLKITAQFVQATPEAVAATWKGVDIGVAIPNISEEEDASGNKTYKTNTGN